MWKLVFFLLCVYLFEVDTCWEVVDEPCNIACAKMAPIVLLDCTIVMLMCSKLCSENPGFSCTHFAALSVLSLPSIVIVIIAVILLDKQAKRVAHTHTHTHK